MDAHEAEGRRMALADLREMGRRATANRVLGAIRKPAQAPPAQPAAQEGPSLMERIQALKGGG